MKKIVYSILVAMTMVGCKGSASSSSAPFEADTMLSSEQIAARRFTPDVMLKMGRIGSSSLSPDGSTIAYTNTYFSVRENKSYTALWTMSVEGGAPIQITVYDQKVSEPTWSGDGSKIYFMSNKSGSNQLHSIGVDGSNQAQITSIDGGINGYGVSGDGANVWLAIDTKVDKIKSSDVFEDMPASNALIYDDLMVRHWDHWENGTFSHIYVAKVENGKVGAVEDIMPGEPWDAPVAPYFDNTEIAWNNAGTALAYTCRKAEGYAYSISTNTDIYHYTLSDKSTRNLTDGMVGYDKYPRFSADDKYMAWQSMERAGNESDKDRLFVLDMASGDKRYVTSDFDYNASSVVWNGKSVYFLAPIEATVQICKANIESDSSKIEVLTQGLHDYTTLSIASGKAIAEKTTLSSASEIYGIDLGSGADTQLSFVNKRIYDAVDMGRVEKRWITTSDNKQMLTWVIVPPDFDSTKKYPTLLYCQGGPQSTVSQSWSYRWNFQLMAGQGYIIVAPNRRGLPSFGQEWLDQISGDYSGQNIRDYFSAIDEVSKEPYVDTSRMGCVGASYGGYSVFYIAGHHEKRFKAFISHCGIFDFTSMYGSTEELWFVNNDYGGAYWDFANATAMRSYANSPHHFVNNWDTPIMIITGLQDFRIPYTQSLEAFTAARAHGIDARLVAFEDEAHQVFKAQNAIVWNREFFGWLDKYLK